MQFKDSDPIDVPVEVVGTKMSGVEGFPGSEDIVARASKVRISDSDLARFKELDGALNAARTVHEEYCRFLANAYGFAGRKWTIDPDAGTLQVKA